MNLEEQFYKNRKKVKSLGGYITVVGVSPEKKTYKTPLFIASGWGESLEDTKGIAITLAKTGRKVYVAEYFQLDHIVHDSKSFPPHGYIKALALLEFFKEEEIESIDIIAHSEGAINAVIIAWIKPKIINTLILVAPAGMMDQDTFLKLAGRFSSNLFYYFIFHSQKKISFTIKYITQVFKYIFSNPLQALWEAVGMAHFNIGKIIHDLQKKKMNIHIVQDMDDMVFPYKEVKKTVKQMHLKNFHSVEGGHNGLHNDPEKFTELFVTILNT